MIEKAIMVVDDDKNTRRLIEDILTKNKQYQVIQASNGEACLKKLETDTVDLILLDLQMPGIDGIETLKRIRQRHHDLPVIIMTAHGTIDRAVSSMKLGSHDFLAKPFPAERLRVTVKNALETSALESELKSLRSELKDRYQIDNIIGQSRIMQSVFNAVQKIIDSEVTVLIQGESGTGKELFARAIHEHCHTRRKKPFVAVNCTALPESLLESELFGHEKGAFTGAATKRIGKFELADGGTVFLDEIGEMSQSTQAKILRVLQEREFERVGGNELIKVNIRLISATNKNLEDEVRKGNFREDLFYRISVYPIKLPPLRDRKEDIPLLTAHFIKRYNKREKKMVEKIQPEALKILLNYNWPGNIRELENTIERAVVITNTKTITIDDLPPHVIAMGEKEPIKIDETLPKWKEKHEIEILRKTLLEFEGNITQAAKKLGIGRATIYRKAKKYNLPISR
jgi:DNA-binding NtrC family response regulator